LGRRRRKLVVVLAVESKNSGLVERVVHESAPFVENARNLKYQLRG